MKVRIRNKKLGKLINDRRKLVRKFGDQNAKLIIKRLNELQAADSLGTMLEFRIGRCHRLSSNLDGMYALDLKHPDRLIIKPAIGKNIDISKLSMKDVKEVIVWEVEDYHGK